MDRKTREEALLGAALWTMTVGIALGRSLLRGAAARVVGPVEGREGEDVETEIDRQFHNLFANLAERFANLTDSSVRLFSEHGISGPEDAQLGLVVDPIGGTKYIQEGHREGVWSVWSLINLETGLPIVGGAVDIRNGQVFLVDDEVRFADTEWAFGDRGFGEAVSGSGRLEVSSETTVSAYAGDLAYGGLVLQLLAPLVDRTLPSAGAERIRPFVWHAGGESTGPYLALGGGRGGVDAYVSVLEPYDELACWLAFLHAVPGSVLVSVREDGSFEDLREFDRETYERRGRIPIVVAAASPELAADVISYMTPDGVEMAYDEYRRL